MSKAEEKKQKTIKKCNRCGATKFRQHAKGPIVNDKMKIEGYDFQCLGCHAVVDELSKLSDVKA